MDSDKVKYYLDIWKEYMQPMDSGKLGYPKKSSGFMSGGIHSCEDWEESIEKPIGKIVETVINDLPFLQKESIYIVYLGHKSMIDIKVLENYYDSALVMLQKRLTEKNLY